MRACVRIDDDRFQVFHFAALLWSLSGGNKSINNQQPHTHTRTTNVGAKQAHKFCFFSSIMKFIEGSMTMIFLWLDKRWKWKRKKEKILKEKAIKFFSQFQSFNRLKCLFFLILFIFWRKKKIQSNSDHCYRQSFQSLTKVNSAKRFHSFDERKKYEKIKWIFTSWIKLNSTHAFIFN